MFAIAINMSRSVSSYHLRASRLRKMFVSAFHPLHRSLYFLKCPQLYLADALTRYSVLGRKLLQVRGIVR